MDTKGSLRAQSCRKGTKRIKEMDQDLEELSLNFSAWKEDFGSLFFPVAYILKVSFSVLVQLCVEKM